jgi:ketosteroid isomerase-like protein
MNISRSSGRTIRWLTTAMMMLGLLSAPAFAQKKNKNAKNDASSLPMPPVPVPEEIDHNIGEMLGAWQVGDVEAMHKYYDDNVTIVAGTYEPPIIGWANYAAAYQKMHARIQEMQFVRRNTFIFNRGDMAWAMYQWEFFGMVDRVRTPMLHGQTTLVFSKTGDRWLIVHNHSSQICDEAPAPAAAPAAPGPGATPGAPPRNPPSQ